MCLQVALLVVSFKLNWNLDMVCTPLQVVILLHLAWGIGHAAHQWIELTKEGLPPPYNYCLATELVSRKAPNTYARTEEKVQ